MSAPKVPHKRTPRTLRDSRFSVPERNRVRTALITYMRRFGASPAKVMEEMDKLLPEQFWGVIKDRTQINAFLKGAEPEDEKIDAFIKLIGFVDPDLAVGIKDDEFVLKLGDALSDFFMPFENIHGYDKAVEIQALQNRGGLYLDVDPIQNEFSGIESVSALSGLNFLLLRPIANSPFARCDFFRFYESPDKERGEIQELKFKIDQLNEHAAQYDRLNSSEPYPEGYIETAAKIMSEYLLLAHDLDLMPETHLEYSGIHCHNGFFGYFFARSPLRAQSSYWPC